MKSILITVVISACLGTMPILAHASMCYNHGSSSVCFIKWENKSEVKQYLTCVEHAFNKIRYITILPHGVNVTGITNGLFDSGITIEYAGLCINEILHDHYFEITPGNRDNGIQIVTFNANAPIECQMGKRDKQKRFPG